MDRVDFTCHGLYYRFSEGRHAVSDQEFTLVTLHRVKADVFSRSCQFDSEETVSGKAKATRELCR